MTVQDTIHQARQKKLDQRSQYSASKRSDATTSSGSGNFKMRPSPDRLVTNTDMQPLLRKTRRPVREEQNEDDSVGMFMNFLQPTGRCLMIA